MRKLLYAVLVTAVSLTVTGVTGCSSASPDAGHEQVWVEKPAFFGHGGVDPEPVTTGVSYGAPTSDHVDVNMYDMQDIAVSQSAVDAATQSITKGAYAIAANTGMPIQLLSVNVGRILPPDAVKNQRIETAAQEQRVITMQQTKLAEDSRKAAEQSRAAADNAYRQEMQLSPEQYIQLERIKMQRDVCERTACTIFIDSKATPTIDVGRK